MHPSVFIHFYPMVIFPPLIALIVIYPHLALYAYGEIFKEGSTKFIAGSLE